MRTEERREHLRTALVDAAEAVIAREGLTGLKARDLAQTVGCAIGTIYTVFPDLDALILAVNLRTLLLFDATITQVRTESVPAGAPGTAARSAAIEDLVRLAVAYLRFAREHPMRWRALFQHRRETAPPDWYLREQGRLFRTIEGPLQVLCPRLDETERALLARSLFSATHGLVGLGLDEKLMSLSDAVLRGQIETVVTAIGRGLIAQDSAKGQP
ncbi:TetR/AcrR family transcriptional regulator [uncultured Methylobacterium sp.]|jgi:AcrR family transcriptional regulator|uniref:TetR/AcrR family transcriptional regulator n=1 Tax=uncultured Methylobacterium sp. TaxID=157278 RepID=UPI00262127E7|nr:TetR/AcrR family transcriptional regulator [uncultured Methylobacterium sp.]